MRGGPFSPSGPLLPIDCDRGKRSQRRRHANRRASCPARGSARSHGRTEF